MDPSGGGVGVGGGLRYPMGTSSEENMYEAVDSPEGSEFSEGPAAPSSHQQQQQQPPPQQHREMAIDCPASFVGIKKETPRFPSRPNSGSFQSTPPVGLAKRGGGDPYLTGGGGSGGSGSGTRRHPDLTPAPGSSAAAGAAPSPLAAHQPQPPRLTREEELQQLERIKKYQEGLRRRREEEERLNREQDFLRTSLRGSKKLQALEESRKENRPPPTLAAPAGIVNPNYLLEEEDMVSADSASKSSTLPVRAHAGTVQPLAHKVIGREVLLSQLQHIQRGAKSIEDQKSAAFLQDLFARPEFQNAMSTYNKVAEVTLRNPRAAPADENAQELADHVVSVLPKQHHHSPAGGALEELRTLLGRVHFKNLLYSHDLIGQQKAEPAHNTNEDDEREYLYERASQYGDEIKIVRLQKTADPLGATVRNEGDRVVIGRIVKGGAAEKSGLLHEGDEILEINGNDIRGKSVNEVCDLMASLTGTLTFLITPSLDHPTSPRNPDKLVHMRAHFDYDPEEDLYIPCRELGISFTKGDILHVLNQEDANWWQAYREGEEDQSLAGLIPSRTFQEQREALKQTIVGDEKRGAKKKKNGCHCTSKSQKKKKKKQLYNAAGEDLDAEEILTYEDVAQYYPQPNKKRPVVLIGPPNVGRQELRQRLMESDMDRFAAAVPHTSRIRKEVELDGKDYHFVPRHVFEQDIASHRFVEYGEFEKNLYGTSLDAIRETVNAGKICILNLHPQSLRILKASDLKPYVVFIAPPNIEKLKQLRQKQGVKVTDSELIDIIEKAREMEENYGHYFDLIVMNYDLDKAYDELVADINKLEVEPQWVPAQWVT